MREYGSRKDALKSPQFRRTVLAVQATIPKDIDYALIGGLAVAYYANPPVTLDVDFLTTAEFSDPAFSAFRTGMRSARWGEARLAFATNQAGRSKGGVAFERMLPDCEGCERVDFLFTGPDSYLMSVVKNASKVLIQDVRLKVAHAEDIIILKTLAGRDKDVDDTFEIMRAVKVDQKYIDRILSRLL